MRIFYFFLKNAIDDTPVEQPICTQNFLGEIGDFIEQDGVGYIITDYAEEYEVEDTESIYW